ncbi:MAG: hypothetical protein LUD27_00995 [Clostridia bacterium]|nr:hypothetical protein [Clostridia bacterium]
MSKTKTENKLIRILTYILVLLLCVGLLGGIVYLLRRSVGMYADYNGSVITSSNDGITVDYSETETAVFTIGNYNDWGVYSVTDCTVKVINNVSSKSSYDFEYTANGSTSNYSGITDFTSVFTTSGSTVAVSEDGTFELAFKYSSMSDILKAYAGTAVSIDGSPDIYSYPYFAIQITSPDEESVIKIPFVYNTTAVTNVTISPNAIIF